MTRYFPVWEKQDNCFIFPYEDMAGDDETEATKIALGMMLVEAVLWNMTYTGTILDLADKNLPHIKAKLAGLDIALVSGPLFNSVSKE